LKNLLLFFLILLNSFSYSQIITPIADLKQNDSNGVPLDTGKVFTISGIVTSSNQLGNSGPGSVQDNTGSISVYGSTFANKVNIGDSVVVTAVLSQYSGLAELVPISSSDVNVISSNHQVLPVIVTISQIVNQEWNGVEDYEGKLIRINNVSISGSGNFSGGSSGQNYDISDTTGVLTAGLRIDKDVATIVGTPIPTSKVDIIGILGQYKYAPPYNSGYQLFPRFISDIVDNGSPLILSPVLAADIDTASFTVYFKTARNGDTKIRYGLTKSLELDSLSINNDTTVHVIKVTGLLPSRTYYYKVYSSNSVGTSESSLGLVTTASTNPLIGALNIYFNFPVDTSLALSGNAAHGDVDFQQKILNRINHANYSIDLAVYSFSGMPDVADALVVAKNRGVKIRVVYDSRTTQDNIQTLLNAGIKISKRPVSLSGIMHNKFFIFDARDTIAANDWLWTGSWNITNTELEWKNNVVEINDPAITKAYQTEFEEMWGSDTDEPDPAKAKFGNMKSDNTPHIFNIGGRDVQLYFSPSDATTSHIINTINSADHSVYMALYVFTRNDIESALYNKFNSGVSDIRSVIHDINASGSEYNNLKNFSEALQNPSPTLHDKYAIIDALNPESQPAVITGSHNWSSAAENDNDENTLIIYDSLIANQFLQDFKARYNDAGGTKPFIVPNSVSGSRNQNEIIYSLYQNYPNPFNPSTSISFSIPMESFVTIKIFNILGQVIKTLVDKKESAGSYKVNFNAAGLSSGIYFYSIEAVSDRGQAVNYYSVKKMIFLK
jgi:phosphatidylserine/phosphatidylglycerophosphate/cardiolipin synthase-like enzyme